MNKIIVSTLALFVTLPAVASAAEADVVVATHHRHHRNVEIINEDGNRLHHRRHDSISFYDHGRRHHRRDAVVVIGATGHRHHRHHHVVVQDGGGY